MLNARIELRGEELFCADTGGLYPPMWRFYQRPR
jgi:hypothetical protein